MSELRRKTTGAVIWTAAQNATTGLVALLAIVVLSRVLPTRAFGLVAEAAALVLLVSTLGRWGLVETLVARKDITSERHTAFWLQLLLAGASYLLCWILADVWDAVFGRKEVAGLLRMLSWVVVAESLGTVPQAILESQLRFKSLALVRFAANLLSAAAAVTWALCGYGVYSLVVQLLVLATARNLGMWLVSGYIPKGAGRVKTAGELLSFGGQVVGAQLLSLGGIQGSVLLVGWFWGEHSLGLFKVAWDLFDKVYRVVNAPLHSVALPGFSRVTAERERLSHALVVSTRTQTLVLLPALVGLLLIADDLVPLLLGAKWLAAAPVLQAFCLLGVAYTLGAFFPQLFTALGRPNVVMGMRAGIVLGQLSALALCQHQALSLATKIFVLVQFPFLGIYLLLAAKQGVAVRWYLSEMLRILAAVAVMAGLVASRQQLFQLTAPASVTVDVLSGMATYALAVWLTARNAVTHSWSLLRIGVGELHFPDH